MATMQPLPEPKALLVTGIVIDDLGNPVARASIELSKAEKTLAKVFSDEAGEFSLETQLEDLGEYLLEVFAMEFTGERQVIDVSEKHRSLQDGRDVYSVPTVLRMEEDETKTSSFVGIQESAGIELQDWRGAITRAGSLPQFRGPEMQDVVPVFFATDRRATGNSSPLKAFSGKREEHVINYGRCLVSIPEDHKPGHIERPSLFRFEINEDEAKHIVIKSIDGFSREIFFDGVRERAAQAEDSAFVFIHGYNVTFPEAIWRTAQLAFDMSFIGAPICFSWPSQGKMVPYTADEATISSSRHTFAGFLALLLTSVRLKTLHVMGHSMGCRALLDAASEIATSHPGVFKNLIFGAPDVDKGDFEKGIPKGLKCADKVSMYVSSRDLAIRLSKKFHSFPRAGDAGRNILVVDNMDTIDTTAIGTGLLAHSYITDHQQVIDDLRLMLIQKSPLPRNLDKRHSVHGTYWAFNPA
jgi:esterase/lipase superfamily enzyme